MWPAGGSRSAWLKGSCVCVCVKVDLSSMRPSVIIFHRFRNQTSGVASTSAPPLPWWTVGGQMWMGLQVHPGSYLISLLSSQSVFADVALMDQTHRNKRS